MAHYRSMIVTALALLLTTSAPSSKPISIDVKDADVHNVLRLLADVGQINLVVSDSVSGRVTLKLKNVPWHQALDVVLKARGLGQERNGNVIQVDTLEAFAHRAELEAKMRASEVALAPLITVLIPLSYARAAEIQPLVASRLSARGSVAIDVRTNTLIVTDVASNVDAARRIVL